MKKLTLVVNARHCGSGSPNFGPARSLESINSGCSLRTRNGQENVPVRRCRRLCENEPPKKECEKPTPWFGNSSTGDQKVVERSPIAIDCSHLTEHFS